MVATVSDTCPYGWRRKHQFEARYDKSAADLGGTKSLNGYGVADVLETLRTKTYVRDVCVNCGKTIERSKP